MAELYPGLESVEDLSSPWPWPMGMAGLVKWLTWETENILGISQPRARGESLLRLLDDDPELQDILSRVVTTGDHYANELHLGPTEVHAEERIVDCRVSPVTADHVNPERPWPALDRLREVTEATGHTLAPRLTVHPRFAVDPERWLDARLHFPVADRSDSIRASQYISRIAYYFANMIGLQQT